MRTTGRARRLSAWQLCINALHYCTVSSVSCNVLCCRNAAGRSVEGGGFAY